MKLSNSTHLSTPKLEKVLLRAIDGWPHDGVDVRVRYSRGADFSGTCNYTSGRILVNLGRHNSYPYSLDTMIARPQSDSRYWWRELYSVEVRDAYLMVLFVFMHEFYHWLVKKARRNVRQKEARCDRFATRALVDGYGAVVRDAKGRAAPRDAWDFQDLDGFVAAARGKRVRRTRAARTPRVQPPRPIAAAFPLTGRQLLLFDS
jgi:hypothetical protein